MEKPMFFPPGFDAAIAREAARLAQQAYDQLNQKGAWKLDPHYDLLGTFSAKPGGLLAPLTEKEPFGFAARNRTSGDVFVSFRGTQSLDDWISNATFPQVPFLNWGQVEEGFLGVYQQCAADMQSAVRSASGARLFVTGHSLGGALSTLGAADLVNLGMKAGLYNFASPRAGDPAFAGNFNARVDAAWRVVNTEDIVTTVPLATPALTPKLLDLLKPTHHLDYEHVGTPVNFTKNNGSVIGNHGMATYLAALGA
jgi:triacylglycerol lipase